MPSLAHGPHNFLQCIAKLCFKLFRPLSRDMGTSLGNESGVTPDEAGISGLGWLGEGFPIQVCLRAKGGEGILWVFRGFGPYVSCFVASLISAWVFGKLEFFFVVAFLLKS